MKTLKQFKEAATGYRKVKSPDEQKFIDKHEVETVPDKNGNGDEVFKASNTKKVDRKKDRKGYEPGEDEKVYEGVAAYDGDKLVGNYPDMKTAKKMKPDHRYVTKLTKGWGDGGKSMKANYGKMAKEEAERLEMFNDSIKDLPTRLQESMHSIYDRLNVENTDKFVAACQTEEGLEKMVAFAIENRGE